MADSMVEAFEAIVTGSGNAGEAVVKMIQDIAAELLKAQIMGFLFNLANKWKLGPFSGIDSTTITGTGTPVGRAMGGPLKKGQFAMVGEQGPELFVPSMSGNVISNRKFSGSSQQIHITNHYTIQALDGASVRDILSREQKTIAGLAMDTINRHRSLKRY
jgi:hypothetical protein